VSGAPHTFTLGSMKLKLLTGLYLGLWITVAVVLAYFGLGIGVSPWITAAGVFVAFFFINGSLAYHFRSRQLRREGQTPPRYINYLFQTDKFNFNEPTQVPALVRIVLGLIVSFGAALFLFAGGVFILAHQSSRHLLAGCILFSLGAAFAYVGYRVIRMNHPSRRLFGRDRDVGLPNNSPQPTANDAAAERPR